MAIFFDIDAKIDQAINKIKQVASSVDTITKATENASKIIESALSDAVPADSFKESLNVLSQGIDDARQEVETLTSSMGNLSGEEFTEASSRVEELNSQLQVAEATYAGVESAFESYVADLNSGTEANEKHNKTLVSLLGGEENLKKILGALPPELRSVVAGIDSMTASAWAFIATPLGAVLAAIVLALGSVYTWLSSTTEGEEELAKITGYLSGVMDQLKEVVIKVGEYLYKAFHEPQKALDDLMVKIKNNLILRMQGVAKYWETLGQMMKAVLSGDFDESKWSKMKTNLLDAVVQVTRGIDDFSGKMDALDKYGQKKAKISLRQQALEKKKSDWSVEEQKIDNELRKLADSNTSGGNREKNRARAEELVNQKYEMRTKLAQEAYDIQKDSMALTSNTLADEQKLNELERQLLQLEGDRTQEMRRFNAQAFNAGKGADSAAAKAAKEAMLAAQNAAKINDQEYNLQKQAQRNKIKLELDTEQAILDQREDGYQKRLDQIALNYKKEQEAIRQAEEDLREENYQQAKKEWETKNKTTFTGKRTDSSYDLNDEQRSYIKERNDLNDHNNKQALDKEEELQKNALRNYLEKYGSYQDQKLAITEKYNKLIEKANNEGLQGQAMSYQKEMEQALSSINFDELKDNLNWELIFGDLKNQSLKVLKEVRDNLRNFANSNEFKKASETDKKTINEAINNLNDAINDKTPIFSNVKSAVDNRKKALEELTKAEIELREAEITYQTTMQIGSVEQQREARDKVQKARSNKNSKQNDLQSAEGQLNKTSKTTVDSITNIANALGDLGSASEMSQAKVGQLISSLMTAIGGTGSELSKIGGYIGAAFSLSEEIGKVGIGDFVKNILQQAGSSILNVLNFGDWIGIGSNIEDCQKTIDEANTKNEILAQSLDKLDDTIKNSDLSKLNSVYENAKDLTAEQMKNASKALVAEASKHDTARSSLNASVNDNSGFITSMQRISEILGKNITTSQQFLSLSAQELAQVRDADNGKTLNSILQEYRDEGGKGGRSSDLPQQILDYIKTYENVFTDLESTINEALTGITFDSLESDFKSTLKDMENDADTFGDKLEDILRDAVINGISKDYQEDLKKWYEDFSTAMNEGLSNAEASALRTRYEQITNAAIAERDQALKALGLDETSTISASQRSVASMSEETASELNGRFTALQISGETISENVVNGIVELRNIGSSLTDTNVLLSEINMSVIACNGTLNSIYNANENGFRKMVEAINSVQSTINSKL